jgi:hypothetical protein
MPDLNAIFSAAALTDDATVRQQGIGFIDGAISGYTLLMGDDVALVPVLLESLIEKQLVVFVADELLLDAIRDTGMSLGWESHVIPMSLTNALGFIIRVAQVFGSANDSDAVLHYARERLRGFTVLLGNPTPDRLTLAQVATLLGCLLLSTADLPSSITTWEIPADYRAAIGGIDPSDIVQLGIEERGLQIHVPMPVLPVAYSPEPQRGKILWMDGSRSSGRTWMQV